MTSSTSAGREGRPLALEREAVIREVANKFADRRNPGNQCDTYLELLAEIDRLRRPPVVRGPDQELRDAARNEAFKEAAEMVRQHCRGEGWDEDYLHGLIQDFEIAGHRAAGEGPAALHAAAQQLLDALASFNSAYLIRDHKALWAAADALRLALSGTTKEVSAEEEEPATCWCPSGVAHDPDCPDHKKRQAGVSESSTSLGASGRNRPVGHGPSGTPAVGDNGVPVAPGSSAEASAASPAPAVSGEPRTTRKEGIPHELAAEIRRAAANLANDYEMGERPCCADLARRIARGIRKLDLEAFAKASGEPRRGIPLTRVEVIDHRADSETFGRAFVAWDVAMELSYQDHGRTLKVFVDDKGALPNNPGEQAASASGANASNAESAQDGASPAGIPREPSEQAVRAAALALNNFNSDKYPWVEGSNWSVVWRDLTAALKAAYAVDSVAPAPTSEGPHESGTYGELPFSIRRMVAGHEWDNMDREQQRAWLIQRLAVSEGPLPHSPPSLLESQMYKERLLPCPFCGAAAVRRMVSVGCGNEFCRVRPNVIAKDAAEFWNVRGLPSVSDPEKR